MPFDVEADGMGTLAADPDQDAAVDQKTIRFAFQPVMHIRFSMCL